MRREWASESKDLLTTSFCKIAAAEKNHCENKVTRAGPREKAEQETQKPGHNHASLSRYISPSRSPAGIPTFGFCETPPFPPNTSFSFGCDQRQTMFLVQPSLSEIQRDQAARVSPENNWSCGEEGRWATEGFPTTRPGARGRNEASDRSHMGKLGRPYPERPGARRSPASPPGTGSSGRGPAAPTPPG